MKKLFPECEEQLKKWEYLSMKDRPEVQRVNNKADHPSVDLPDPFGNYYVYPDLASINDALNA